jgi:hypothetical protein
MPGETRARRSVPAWSVTRANTGSGDPDHPLRLGRCGGERTGIESVRQPFGSEMLTPVIAQPLDQWIEVKFADGPPWD